MGRQKRIMDKRKDMSQKDINEFIEENADSLTQGEVMDLSPDRQFEYGVSYPMGERNKGFTPPTYTKYANTKFRINNIEEILDNIEILESMIEYHHSKQVPRLRLLEEYYLGNNPHIMNGKRRDQPNKSDHRARHAFPRAISSFLNAYILGNPVKIEPAYDSDFPKERNEDNPFLDYIDKFNRNNYIDSHNIEIGLDQNNFGRAYELLVRNKRDEDKLYRLDPKETFMIYDTTVATTVIGAVRYYSTYDWVADEDEYTVDLYDYYNMYRYKGKMQGSRIELEFVGQEPHSFNGVPIVEYKSDRYGLGTFEQQIPLIDLYDSAQSDTANYMSDFNDAILTIEGTIGRNISDRELAGMLEANILLLEPSSDGTGTTSQPHAGYLTKQYDVQGVEAYKDRLKTDIYSQSNTPDLSDDNFSGNSSGIAMQYKTFGLQQKQKDKEKYLAKGFRVRYKLLENINRATRQYTGDPVKLDFVFSPNLPKAQLEELRSFHHAGGKISNETKLSLLSFVDNPKEERKKLEEEHAREIAEGLRESYDYLSQDRIENQEHEQYPESITVDDNNKDKEQDDLNG